MSSVEEGERESDATLINNNEGLRVDIGFIGRGNSEISLDKVSRYRQQADINGGKYEMSTVIIVDRIGDKSGIVEKAEEIKGKIFQMCNKNWIVELAQCVYDKLGVDVGFHLIKDDKELIAKIEEEMEKVSIKDLLNN